MTAIDFAAVPRVPDGAAWYLDWDHEDLNAPVLGGLRLLLNSAHPRITSAVRTASDDPAAAIVRSLIECDVARQLVHAALDSEQFVERPEAFVDDSVGRMLADLLTMVWPGIAVRGLRQRARLEPSRIEAELQEALRVAA
jgi:hypothetical protein